MDEIRIILTIAKELGWKVCVLLLYSWIALKELRTFLRKRNGEYVSFKTIEKISQKLDKHIVDTTKDIQNLKHDSQGVMIMIEKRHSEIETLRIVSEKMYEVVNQTIRELKEDTRETREDIRQIKDILIRGEIKVK